MPLKCKWLSGILISLETDLPIIMGMLYICFDFFFAMKLSPAMVKIGFIGGYLCNRPF